MQLSFQIERASNYRVYDTISKKSDPYVEKALYLDTYRLKLIFRDGNINHIDFKPFLKKSKNPLISKYLDLAKFKKYHLEDGRLLWGNDLEFESESLYNNNL
ncbi:MAG: DUF2442 domain-containing protein [Calditrichaeota bacterium]|nr:MAG: DUF2442 domain-containing protein [Calditrichota bacterium]MBL1205050.1 DUF2442 domain-containing protein [Calditrichota bacterium]NOG44880.1 DUF2442 domain-containing protein [Calditrichota bacterium]